MTITPDTYLATAVDRLMDGYREVLGDLTPPIRQVVDYLDTGLTPPFVWLYPGVATGTEFSHTSETQQYAVMARVVIGYGTEGFDGRLSRALWTYLPTLRNYFMQRRALVFDSEQAPVPWLRDDETGFRQVSPLGLFSNLNHFGLELAHILAFTKRNEQVYF